MTYVFFKWQEKHILEKKYSSFSSPAAVQTKDIRNLFKLEKKWKEVKLQNQVNDNQTEDNSNVIH